MASEPLAASTGNQSFKSSSLACTEGLGKGPPRLVGYNLSVWWSSTVVCSPAGKGRGKAGAWRENAHLRAFLSSFLPRCSHPVTNQDLLKQLHLRAAGPGLDATLGPAARSRASEQEPERQPELPEGGRGRMTRARAHLRLHPERTRVSRVQSQLARPS